MSNVNDAPHPNKRRRKSSVDELLKISVHSTANIPVDSDGRLYHLGLKKGEVANRIVTVGDLRRAFALAEVFDDAPILSNDLPEIDVITMGVTKINELFPHVKIHASHRGFITLTGKYKGTHVSVVAIGMGYPMMDFFVREVREIVQGPIAVIRFGTCGSINPEHGVGIFAVNTEGAILVTRNPDAFDNSNDGVEPYNISKPCLPDKKLTSLLLEKLKNNDRGIPVATSLNATCDSFYSSQARPERHYIDKNDDLFLSIEKRYPQTSTLDMETFQLFHLARCVKEPENEIKATSLKIIAANRPLNVFLVDESLKRKLEKIGGRVCLETLREFQFE